MWAYSLEECSVLATQKCRASIDKVAKDPKAFRLVLGNSHDSVLSAASRKACMWDKTFFLWTSVVCICCELKRRELGLVCAVCVIDLNSRINGAQGYNHDLCVWMWNLQSWSLLEFVHTGTGVVLQLDLKKTLMDRYLHLISFGYVLPVLAFIQQCTEDKSFDRSVLRHFVSEVSSCTVLNVVPSLHSDHSILAVVSASIFTQYNVMPLKFEDLASWRFQTHLGQTFCGNMDSVTLCSWAECPCIKWLIENTMSCVSFFLGFSCWIWLGPRIHELSWTHCCPLSRLPKLRLLFGWQMVLTQFLCSLVSKNCVLWLCKVCHRSQSKYYLYFHPLPENCIEIWETQNPLMFLLVRPDGTWLCPPSSEMNLDCCFV